MGKVSLNINGRAYGLGCEDGEEERLTRLGQRLDERVEQMAQQFGQIGDLRLLVMAGITLLDELDGPAGDAQNAAQSRADAAVDAARSDAKAAAQAREETEAQAAQSLITAAQRIERLAERLADANRT